MDTFDKASNWYLALKDVPGIAAQVAARQQALALELMNGSNPLEVTSFTINGQSAAGALSSTREEQLDILNRVAGMLKNNAAGSRRTVPSF